MAAARPGMTRRRFAAAVGLLAVMPGGAVEAALAPPRRVAVLDWGLAETVLALGLTPLAVAEAPLYRQRVVVPALPDEVRDLGLRTWPNMERLKALRPDLIVALDGYGVPAARLEAIAPALALPVYTPDRAPLRLAGEALDALAVTLNRRAQAEAVRAELEATLEAAAVRLADIADRPLFIVKFADDRHLDVFGAGSLFDDVLRRLGLVNAWTGATNIWGYATIGLEGLAAVPEARVVVIAPGPSAALADSRLWRSLPPVRENRLVTVPPAWVFGALPSARRFCAALTEALVAGGRG